MIQCRISGPIMGVDGKPLDLGQADWHLSDAKMSKQFLELQQSNLSGLDKLNAKLRKEYDTAKLANKRKMKELQFISSELSQIERVLSGSERSSGPAAAAEATVSDCDVKIQEVQDACQVRHQPSTTITMPRSATHASFIAAAIGTQH
jgi:hypothetical protein